MADVAEKNMIQEYQDLSGGSGILGGKASNLLRLHKYGFSVPPWKVIPTSVFERVIGPHRPQIESVLAQISDTDREQLTVVSRHIAEIIREAFKDLSLADLITKLRFLSEDNLYSVRSSCVGEDSREHSFAGLMDSYLNVPAAEIPETVQLVFASAYSTRALAYRHRKSLPLGNISAAVIIQEMIQSETAGVLFTRSPDGEADHCIISAGFGLGEGIVSNKVATDTYKINRNSHRLYREIHEKDFRVVLDKTHGDHSCVEELPLALRKRPVLADKQIRKLYSVALRAEKCFGAPQDMEWAFDSRGRLFILQTRPIVSNMQKDRDNFNLWDNANIVESYPGLTLPLTFSFVHSCYEKTFSKATLGFLLIKKELNPHMAIFKQMIGLLDGRVYYNLLNWYRMLSFLPGFHEHKKCWDNMIGITQSVDFKEQRLSLFNRLWVVIMVLRHILRVKSNSDRFFAHFNFNYVRFRDLDYETDDEMTLISHFESLDRCFVNHWHLTLYNDLCAMKYYDWLKKLCAGSELRSHANLYNDLLGAEREVESVAPIHALKAIVKKILSFSSYRQLFNNPDCIDIWRQIRGRSDFQELKTMIQDYLLAFGDRGLEELKLETPTFREAPERLIELIAAYVHRGIDATGKEVLTEKNRLEAERIVRSNIRNPLHRWLFNWVLRNARMSVKNRENMRFARTRLFGIVRRIFRRFGELFEEKGLIQSKEDIHYLTVSEIFATVRGTAVSQDLKALVESRRAEYEEFARHDLPERCETHGIPMLNSLNEEGHVLNHAVSLHGIGCSSGIAKSTCRVVMDPHQTDGIEDRILVAKSTDPGWIFLMMAAKGLIVEKGSVLSHTAIVGRELEIPTIVGVKNATQLIRDGDRIWMNGDTGQVTNLGPQNG